MKKFITMIGISASLIALSASSVFAGVIFADIDDAPWSGAKIYIQSVADSNLMIGDVNSSGRNVFRPKDNLSYNEGVQLAYSVLKANDALKSDTDYTAKYLSVMAQNNIPSWAMLAVGYGLETGIVKASELPKFMNGTTSNYATREDISLFFGRALSQLTNVPASAALSFGDAGSISSEAAPYISLLAKEDIITGYDDGNFYPAEKMNRAQLAVVVSKTNEKIKELSDDGGIRGTVTNIIDNDATVTIQMLVGSNIQNFMGAKTTFSMMENGSGFDFSEINKGDIITAYASGGYLTKVIVHSHTAPATTEVSGTVAYITSDKINIIPSGGSETAYYFKDNVSITENGSSSTVRSIMSASEDYKLTATLTTDSSNKVSKVSVTYDNSYITGTIRSMDSESISIRKASGGSTTYYFASSVTYRLDGSSSSNSKLQTAVEDYDNIEANIYLNSSDKITRIEATTSSNSSTSVKGTITSFEDDYIKVKKTSSSGSTTYDFSSSVTYTLDGSTSTWTKINNEFKDYDLYATLTLNSSGKVTKVAATYESDSDTIKGTLRSVDVDNEKITLRKSGASSNVSYYLASSATLKIDGTERSLSRVETAFDDYDGYPEIEIVLNSSNRITSLKLYVDSSSSGSTTTVKGTLSWIEDKELRIKKTSGDSTTYTLASSVSYYLNGSSSSFSRISSAVETAKNNSETISITATLNSSSKVTRVEITTVEDGYSGTVNSVISTANYMKFTSGSKTYLVNTAAATVTLNGSNSSMSTIQSYFDGGTTLKVIVVFDTTPSSGTDVSPNLAKKIVVTT